MPIPAPKDGEKEKDYIGRCMEFQSKEKDLTDEKVRSQALAICYTTFKTAKTESRIKDFKSVFSTESE